MPVPLRSLAGGLHFWTNHRVWCCRPRLGGDPSSGLWDTRDGALWYDRQLVVEYGEVA